MAKYVIEDTTLTGIADAIRAKTGGTDPIPVTDMATQIAAITGGGSGETLTTVFEEQTVEGFVGDTESGLAHTMINTTSSIVVGESYKVLWDGTEVALIAEDLDGMTALLHEECGFCVQYLPPELMVEIMGTESGAFQFISWDTTATSHTVGIYQKVSSGDSGGSVEGIVYVTYMNGNTELCKTACMKGDSTVDPVEDGKIAVPTKDPTVSTVYTYAGGWALTDGGEADEMALVDVSEDRVVYAAYTESVREYTINFYDDDGATLLESLQVAYGEVPSYTPEKEGYYFNSWSPEITAVTADANYCAQWDERLTFANATWAQIEEICVAGQAQDYFAIGDEREQAGEDGTVYTMRIIGFDLDHNSSGKFAMTCMFVNACTEKLTYQQADTMKNDIYANLVNTVLWGKFGSPVKKTAHTSDGTLANKMTSIFFPSIHEVGLQSAYSAIASVTEDFGAYPGLDTVQERTMASAYWLRNYNDSPSKYYVTATGEAGSTYNDTTAAAGCMPCMAFFLQS